MGNEADQAVYNTEKQLNEYKDKVPQNVKDQIQGDITNLNEAMTTEDADKIREALERLKEGSMELGKAIYSQQSASEEPQPEPEQQQEEPKAEEEPKSEEKKDEEKK